MTDVVCDVKPKKTKLFVSKEQLEILTSTPLLLSIEEYVTIKWTLFFGTKLSDDDHRLLVKYVDEFRQTDQSIQSGFDFIRRNPKLLEYQKVQVGEGEFALFLLFTDAVRVNKGDLKFNGEHYEVKRIKEPNEAIRFGTNVNIQSINNFRYVTFGLKRFFNYCEYSNHPDILPVKSLYNQIIGESDASVTKAKLSELYQFFYTITELCHCGSSVEFNAMCDDVRRVVGPFIQQYPTPEIFGTSVTNELVDFYRNLNTKILIIDHENQFITNPNIVFHSLNQYVRPQMTLVVAFSG